MGADIFSISASLFFLSGSGLLRNLAAGRAGHRRRE
jgi:hypothetical protein